MLNQTALLLPAVAGTPAGENMLRVCSVSLLIVSARLLRESGLIKVGISVDSSLTSVLKKEVTLGEWDMRHA